MNTRGVPRSRRGDCPPLCALRQANGVAAPPWRPPRADRRIIIPGTHTPSEYARRAGHPAPLTMRGVPIAAALVAAVTALKLLCLPAYRSTDFEVHRNWLAITATRPWREWYADGASPSEWTLDYPPLFAAFEWALAQAARLVDPAMLVRRCGFPAPLRPSWASGFAAFFRRRAAVPAKKNKKNSRFQTNHSSALFLVDPAALPQDVNNLGYASDATVLFQRLSVLLSEGLLVWATWHAAAGLPRARRLLALFLVAAHPGLVIVDHIHFQYNGVLLGLFVLATWAVARGRELPGAALFAAALAAKHIFLYAAPAFFVHLLRRRCAGVPPRQGALQFATLGVVVLGVLGPVLGPFLAAGQGAQLARRLFPVSRGLCHAFWAPNFWALYAAADKALAAALPRLGLAAALRPRAGASMTGAPPPPPPGTFRARRRGSAAAAGPPRRRRSQRACAFTHL